MDPPKPKRVRANNWDSSDKILLRQLIEDKISIIENKNCDTNTSRAKKDAWREITNNFNNMSATMRETGQLQAQWRGTKMKAKMNASAYKKSLNATGGGPPPKSPDPEQERLMALIPHEFEEDENEFDCDTEILKENIYTRKDKASPNTRHIERHRKSPLINQYEYDEIEFLEDPCSPLPASTPAQALHRQPPPASPPPSRLGSKKSRSFKRKIICKEDELLKQELFDLAKENRRKEEAYMKLEHEERMKNILTERAEMTKTYQMERRHKEELHQKRMRMLEEHNNYNCDS